MLEKKEYVSKLSVAGEFKFIEVRKTIEILEDGVILSKKYHRHVVQPGDDVSNESPEVLELVALYHTEELVKKYKDLVSKV